MILDVPAGMVLACKTCGWRPDPDLSMGVVAAHFDTEHQTVEVQLELVVVCPRCDQPMTYEHSHGVKDFFTCTVCHRMRTIRRTT